MNDFDGAETLKLMPLLVPPFVATVTVLFPGLADALMVKVTVPPFVATVTVLFPGLADALIVVNVVPVNRRPMMLAVPVVDETIT